ncbi:MAG TPA: molybdopterin-dependent oxidoreductase, partial [Methylomirabilota bacterium]|nr:molybdopterin-dependent oxidoreductase [Methylomirabilota bacterium]
MPNRIASADHDGLSRRAFVIQVGAAATLLGASDRAARGQTAPAPVPGKDKLIVRSPRPINLETPLAELGAEVTPTDVFFVRNNYDGPVIDPTQYVLRVDGEVDSPLTLRLDDLRRMEQVTLPITVE